MELAGHTQRRDGVLTQEAAEPAMSGSFAASSVIEFTVPGVAVPWARAGGGLNTPRFTPGKQRNHMGTIKLFCQQAMAGRPPIEGPIELSVLCVYPWPASWSAKRRAQPEAVWKISRPDEDNLKKIVADALNTVAYRDDAQIASGHCWKKYGDVPRMSVKIRSLTG